MQQLQTSCSRQTRVSMLYKGFNSLPVKQSKNFNASSHWRSIKFGNKRKRKLQRIDIKVGTTNDTTNVKQRQYIEREDVGQSNAHYYRFSSPFHLGVKLMSSWLWLSSQTSPLPCSNLFKIIASCILFYSASKPGRWLPPQRTRQLSKSQTNQQITNIIQYCMQQRSSQSNNNGIANNCCNQKRCH